MRYVQTHREFVLKKNTSIRRMKNSGKIFREANNLNDLEAEGFHLN
jgi:hypothetical protein